MCWVQLKWSLVNWHFRNKKLIDFMSLSTSKLTNVTTSNSTLGYQEVKFCYNIKFCPYKKYFFIHFIIKGGLNMDHNWSHVDSGIFLHRSNIPTWYIFPLNFFSCNGKTKILQNIQNRLEKLSLGWAKNIQFFVSVSQGVRFIFFRKLSCDMDSNRYTF